MYNLIVSLQSLTLIIAILIAGSQNPCKFDLASQLWWYTPHSTPLKWVLSRIHYNYDDNYEEKQTRGRRKREISFRHAYIISNV